MFWYWLFHFCLGLMVGSFLGVVVLRLETGEKGIVFGRSHCSHCQHLLAPRDMIPLLSFFLTCRRCRYCHTPLSWFYPAIELVTGLLFALASISCSGLGQTLWYEIVASLLVVVAFFDLRTQTLPDFISYLGLAFAWCANLLGFGVDLLSGFYGLLIFLLFFGAQILVSRGKWLGTGDLLLGLFLGSLVGWTGSLITLFVAYLSGSAVGIFLLLTHHANRKTALPFAPFLVFGTIAFLFWGESIVSYYRFLVGF